MKPFFNWHHHARNEWNTRAASWNNKSTSLWEHGNRKDIIPFFKKNFKKEENILDIGCGDGYGSYQLFRAGYKVEGVDFSEEMIEYAMKQDYSKDIDFSQADVCHLPFTDQTFEGIMAINVLEWTETPSEGLLEIKRVLKDEGQLCIGILGPTAGPRNNSYPRIYGERTMCNTMMPWELQSLALENGFEMVDGMGVFKEGVNDSHLHSLSLELRQALTFMWVFIFRKAGE